MTILFDNDGLIQSPALVPAAPREAAAFSGGDDAILEIGLVNNMPDAALQSTERQFVQLLNVAACARMVRLHFFALPAAGRSAAAQSRIDNFYADFDALGALRIDGLIVTGAEPRAETLPEENYWDALARLVDWAEMNTTSTIWSCLAAHAAVLHLDGVERQRLDAKCSGVYSCTTRTPDRLTAGLTWPLRVAHSRLNGLSAGDLAAHGYDIVTMAEDAGVDIFVKQWRSRFVFFQGHPEYDSGALKREYLRDVGRFLAGQRGDYPDLPENYFDRESEIGLAEFRLRALARRRPGLLAEMPPVEIRADNATAGKTATGLFANWLDGLAARKAA